MTKILVFMILFSAALSAVALDISSEDIDKTNVTLSSKELNRVSVLGDKIIGMKHSIPVESSNEASTGDVYIKPAANQSGTIFITTEKGRVYKVNVDSKDVTSKNINIFEKEQKKALELKLKSDSINALIQNILEQALATRITKNACIRSHNIERLGLKTKVVSEVKIEDYIVDVVEVKSKKEDVFLRETDFAFENVIAVYLESSRASKATPALAYVVRSNHAKS